MNSTKKAIFLDIDGTLTKVGHNEPCDEDIIQLNKTHDAGHLLFLNTARSLANIPVKLVSAPWLSGVIAGAGAHILLMDNSNETQGPCLKTIYHQWIKPDILHKVYMFFLQRPKWCLFEGERQLYAIHNVNGIRTVIKPIALEDEPRFISTHPEMIITKLTIEGIPNEEEKNILGDFFQLNSQIGFYEGIIHGESKSKAMLNVLNIMGIQKEDSIAIGDSANDIDMVISAGTGIAMGNACKELKDIAAYITDDVDHGGIANFLRKYI
jgi:hydroxymethylpyrimidine pyrophosphatase-like HAD family hydrolase